jgi:hypothetical protein
MIALTKFVLKVIFSITFSVVKNYAVYVPLDVNVWIVFPPELVTVPPVPR